MTRKLFKALGCAALLALGHSGASAQITLLRDYKNNNSAAIGTFQGINFREAGFSALYAIPGTNGKEFWTCSDRGVNVDCASANPTGCTPTYDKLYGFANYAPKIHRIRVKEQHLTLGGLTICLLNANYSSSDAVRWMMRSQQKA